MTFRQFLEQGSKSTINGFGGAGRAGESPYKVAKPQTNPINFKLELPETKPLFRKNKPRPQKGLGPSFKPTKIRGVI